MYPLELEKKRKKVLGQQPPRDIYKGGYLAPPTAPPPTETYNSSTKPPRSKQKSRKKDYLTPPSTPPPTETYNSNKKTPRSKQKSRKNDNLIPPSTSPSVELFSSFPIAKQLSYRNKRYTSPSSKQVNYNSNYLTPPPESPRSKSNSYQNIGLTPPPGSVEKRPINGTDVERIPTRPAETRPVNGTDVKSHPTGPAEIRPPISMKRGLSIEQLSRSRLEPAPTTNYSSSAPSPTQNNQLSNPQGQYRAPQPQHQEEDVWYKAESYMPTNIELNKRKCPSCGAKGFDVNEMEDRNRIISYIPRRIYAKKRVCKKCRFEF